MLITSIDFFIKIYYNLAITNKAKGSFKKMNRKKYYLILDTETTGNINKPLCYDIGLVIIDRAGKIYEQKSFIVKDIFDNKNLMDSAYYYSKIPFYEKSIKQNIMYKTKLITIKQNIETLLKKYNIKEVYAYNCNFDKRALQNTNNVILKDLYGFFFREMQYYCIWHMACQVLCNNRNYKNYCINNNFVSNKGNIQTSAEVVYRYITKNDNFIEEHTALADSKIEALILQAIWKKHKKVDKSINNHCWRIPNRKK